VFDAADVIARHRESSQRARQSLNWYRTLRRFVPRITGNLIADKITDRLRTMLSGIDRPRILVVGGGDVGAGMEALLDDAHYAVIESDVYFGPRCNIIADGHDLPFRAHSFDAVICQAVLEHVARPQACIDAIHRVLKPNGIFFADIPFMTPVHMGAYDFTRFSLGGLRLACRAFEEDTSGISCGPFQAVALMISHSMRALSTSRIWVAFVSLGLPWFIWWLHHLDKLLQHRPQSADVASGVYFLGRKSDRVRGEREVIGEYWRNHVQSQRKRARITVEAPGTAH
jgi:SAM-dependent methyltransferase